MYWDFELVARSREPLIVALENRAQINVIPRSLAIFMIDDIESIQLPLNADKDNYRIVVKSKGHIEDKARTWKFSVKVVAHFD